MYKKKLIEIIGKKTYKDAFVCIKDLLENGLPLDRFTDDCYRPSRHEITLFLAAWCKHIGLHPEAYREWLSGYCVDVLIAISSTKPSQIRHSTKSTIKFIHKSDVPFRCYCEHNIFKLTCSKDCTIYDKMHEIYLLKVEEEKRRIEENKKRSLEAKAAQPPEKILLKDKYKEQFDDAVTLIKEYLDKGYTKKKITMILNEKGYKTITGKDWKTSNLSNLAVEKNWTPKRKKRKKKDN